MFRNFRNWRHRHGLTGAVLLLILCIPTALLSCFGVVGLLVHAMHSDIEQLAANRGACVAECSPYLPLMLSSECYYQPQGDAGPSISCKALQQEGS